MLRLVLEGVRWILRRIVEKGRMSLYQPQSRNVNKVISVFGGVCRCGGGFLSTISTSKDPQKTLIDPFLRREIFRNRD